MNRITLNSLSRYAGVALLTALLVATAANEVLAHGGGGDIALFTTGGQADVGFAKLDADDITQIEFNPDDNVFQSILLPFTPNLIVPWTFASPEPGYDADEGALPNGATITLNTLDVQYWDGNGAVSFSSAVGIAAGYAPPTHATNPADGGFHAHPFFGVVDAGQAVSDGIYLTKLTVSVSGLTDSDPYYMVSLVDSAIAEAEDAEALGESVRAYLDDPSGSPIPTFNGQDYTYYANAILHVEAPEPGTAMLAALALAGVFARRRRWHA